MKNKKYTNVSLAGIGCLVAIIFMVLLAIATRFVLFVVFDGSPSQSEIEEAKRTGDIIFLAIEEYRDETGSYPSALIELVPNTLEEIPSPNSEGGFWTYSLSDNGTRVSLSHDWGEWNPVLYSNGNGWNVDTK